MNPLHLVVLSLVGLLVSLYIYYSKKTGNPMVCLPGASCNEVVRSKYGSLFGIDNSIPGMIYYLFMLSYAIALFFNENLFKEAMFYYPIVGISGLSVLFSAYLTGVQAFMLRKWCYYCLVSTAASALIFATLVM